MCLWAMDGAEGIGSGGKKLPRSSVHVYMTVYVGNASFAHGACMCMLTWRCCGGMPLPTGATERSPRILPSYHTRNREIIKPT